MLLAYLFLCVAYLGWLIVLGRRLRVIWAWLGNDPADSNLGTLTHGDLNKVRNDTFSPLAAYLIFGVIAFTAHAYLAFGIALIILAHVVMFIWLLVVPQGNSDLTWLMKYKPPSRTGKRYAPIVWLHRHLTRGPGRHP